MTPPVQLPGAYLIALLFSVGGLITLDLRFKLAIAIQPKRTMLTLLVAVLFFLGWDAIGVANGIFFEGNSGLLLGLDLANNIPVEELIFLILFCYSILLGYLALERWRLKGRAKE